MKINTFTAEKAQQEAISLLCKAVEDSLRNERSTLLLLSGGANIEIAREAVQEVRGRNQEKFDELITLMVLDERYSSDPALNNSLLLREQGLNVVQTVPSEGESVEKFGERFHSLLRGWLDTHPSSRVIATLGMGADGHIAGISPLGSDPQAFEQLFLQNNALAIGYTGNLQPSERVTVTPSFLQNSIDTIIGYIPGEAKREALQAFIERSSQPHQHPIQLLHQTKGTVILTTDIDIHS